MRLVRPGSAATFVGKAPRNGTRLPRDGCPSDGYSARQCTALRGRTALLVPTPTLSLLTANLANH
jgi:hypothetical protein